MFSASASCIYLQLENQKNAIYSEVIQCLTKELFKLTQIKILQNTLSPTHFTFSCPDCFAHKTQAQKDGSDVSDAQKLDGIKQSLKVIFEDLIPPLDDSSNPLGLGLAGGYPLAQQLLNQIAEDPLFKSLEPKAWKPNFFTDFLNNEGASKSHESAEKMLQRTDYQSQEHRIPQRLEQHSVPRVDRMRNLGFKPDMKLRMLEEKIEKERAMASRKWASPNLKKVKEL